MPKIHIQIKLKKYLNKYFNTEEKRRLISNFLSLSVLQAANYILPLITFPYLVRVLGVEKYGLLAFATATISYFQIITDYGFNLTATRDISIHRKNKDKLTEIFSNVMTIKVILMVFSFVLLVILVSSLELFRKDALIYYCTFGLVIGQVLFPVWFFQGMEEMKYITSLNILSKVIFTILIFIIIKERKDYYWVPILNAIGQFFSGLIAVWLIKNRFSVRYCRVSSGLIKKEIQNSFNVFISSFSINIYIYSNTLILGFFASNLIVGYYALVEKLIFAIRGVASVLFQVIYPYTCALKNDRSRLLAFYKQVFFPTGLFFLVVGFLLFILSESIVLLVSGNNIPESTLVLKILCFVPFIVAMNIPAYQYLLIYELKYKYTMVLVFASFFNIIINIILSPIFFSIGTAFSVLLTELLITISLYISMLGCKKVFFILTRYNNRKKING